MNRARKISVLLCGIWMLSTQSAWTMESGSNRISLRLGAGIPTDANDFKESAKVGLAAGVTYLRAMSDKLSVGSRLNYFNFPANTHRIVMETGGGGVNIDSKSEAYTLEVIGRYDLMKGEKITTYALGGVGANHFSQETKGTPSSGILWANTSTSEQRTLADDSSTGFALSIGAGADMPLSDSIVLGLEAMWHTIGVSKSDFGSASINFPSVAMDIGYKF